MLPNEALKLDIAFDEVPQPEDVKAVESDAITSHGVLVGNIGLLLPRREVSELVNNLAICRLPNTSAWFGGVTSLRGNMLPVFDLHVLLDIAHHGIERRTIVVGQGEHAVAFWVDRMPRLVALSSDDLMSEAPSLPQLIADQCDEYYLRDGQVWVDWNVDGFFSSLGSML
ncbi:MAG TPA: chemotaxis protein CheW [Gammaproteobacteria bacterium]|jgi:twitching motility protein PilI